MRNELVLSRQKRNNSDTEREQNPNQAIHSNQRSNQLTYRTDDFDQRRTNSPKSPFNSYGSLNFSWLFMNGIIKKRTVGSVESKSAIQ